MSDNLEDISYYQRNRERILQRQKEYYKKKETEFISIKKK